MLEHGGQVNEIWSQATQCELLTSVIRRQATLRCRDYDSLRQYEYLLRMERRLVVKSYALIVWRQCSEIGELKNSQVDKWTDEETDPLVTRSEKSERVRKEQGRKRVRKRTERSTVYFHVFVNRADRARKAAYIRSKTTIHSDIARLPMVKHHDMHTHALKANTAFLAPLVWIRIHTWSILEVLILTRMVYKEAWPCLWERQACWCQRDSRVYCTAYVSSASDCMSPRHTSTNTFVSQLLLFLYGWRRVEEGKGGYTGYPCNQYASYRECTCLVHGLREDTPGLHISVHWIYLL